MGRRKSRDYVTADNKPARQLTLSIPDRESHDTDPATKKQIDFLLKLADWGDPSVLGNLGKWQASAMIDKIISERDHLELDAAYGDFDDKRATSGDADVGSSGGFWSYVIGAGFVIWIIVTVIQRLAR